MDFIFCIKVILKKVRVNNVFFRLAFAQIGFFSFAHKKSFCDKSVIAILFCWSCFDPRFNNSNTHWTNSVPHEKPNPILFIKCFLGRRVIRPF